MESSSIKILPLKLFVGEIWISNIQAEPPSPPPISQSKQKSVQIYKTFRSRGKVLLKRNSKDTKNKKTSLLIKQSEKSGPQTSVIWLFIITRIPFFPFQETKKMYKEGLRSEYDIKKTLGESRYIVFSVSSHVSFWLKCIP